MLTVHGFSITVHMPYFEVLHLWPRFFSALGVLIPTDHGGRGYRQIDVAMMAAKVYSNPITLDRTNAEHCHIELPGQACEYLIPDNYRDFLNYLLDAGIRFSIKRVDLAFDNAPFSPELFLEYLEGDTLVSLAKRETIHYDGSPYALRDDGKEGTFTAYIGSNESQRMVRCYNKRGFTRLEFQMRDERAQAVFLSMVFHPFTEWFYIGMSHLRQYIDFRGWALWAEFVSIADRASLLISSARRVSVSRIHSWLDRQVSVALSVYLDVHGSEVGWSQVIDLVERGRQRPSRKRYEAVLQLSHASVGELFNRNIMFAGD